MDRVRLPADVEIEDRLAFGLTARQLGLLAAAALAAYAVYAIAAAALPTPAAAAAATPVAVIGAVLAFGRRHGLGADRLALAATRFLTRPRRCITAPEGLPSAGRARLRGLGALELPVRAVTRSGLVDLGPHGHRLLFRATGTGFALRSTEEQAALVEAFARFLNALEEPVAVLVQSRRADLAPHVAALEHAAADLTHPALREAARSHARFLAALQDEEGLIRREILLVLATHLRERDAAGALLHRRAGEATDLLRQAGVELELLDGTQAAATIGSALDPDGPPDGVSVDRVVRAR